MSSTFNELKTALENGLLQDYACETDEYMDYVTDRYADAITKLESQFKNLYIEPSIQCGMGEVFATYTANGVTYITDWSYSLECECIDEIILECSNEQEFIDAISKFLERRIDDARPAEEDEEYEEDE